MSEKRLFKLSTERPMRNTSDEDVRAENRRLRTLLAAIVESAPTAAALVDVQWDISRGRITYVFCTPDRDEMSAAEALSKAMSDRGFPWDVASSIALEACRVVLKRHGLTKEAAAESSALAQKMAESVRAESTREGCP